MTEKQAAETKKLFSIKWGSDLRSLFYTKRGLPRQKLYSKDEILNELGVPEPENSLERAGILHRLNVSLTQLRREAKDHGLPFVDFHVPRSEGNPIGYHGFVRDPDKLIATIELYKSRQENAESLFQITEGAIHQQLVMLENHNHSKTPKLVNSK